MSLIDPFPKDGTGYLVHQDFVFPLEKDPAWDSDQTASSKHTSGKGVPSSGCRGPSGKVHGLASALRAGFQPLLFCSALSPVQGMFTQQLVLSLFYTKGHQRTALWKVRQWMQLEPKGGLLF